MVGALGLLPTCFSIGSVKINGKTLLKLFQLNLPGVFGFKALQDPEGQIKPVTTSTIMTKNLANWFDRPISKLKMLSSLSNLHSRIFLYIYSVYLNARNKSVQL